MERVCEKCGEVPIDEHHLWCKYLDNTHGNSWKDYDNRIFLCNHCHQQLHKVILSILKKYNPSSIKSLVEYINWRKINIKNRNKVIDIVVKESWRWLKEDDRDS